MARKTQIILDRAMELVKSVPYKVSLRWLFYRLLQEGYYTDKDDYRRWKDRCADHRKQRKGEWAPDTLEDETREYIFNVYGCKTHRQYTKNLPDTICNAIDFHRDHFYKQYNYVEIWFEARAMIKQFAYYTKGIDLVPFGGDPSHSFKWEIAVNLRQAWEKYQKPIMILYFGDWDVKGVEIFDAAIKDIKQWCGELGGDFWYERCGLTLEQAQKYDLPESINKPGEYQWEALTDEAAREIIESSVSKYVDLDLIDKVNKQTEKKNEQWRDKLRPVVQSLINGG